MKSFLDLLKHIESLPRMSTLIIGSSKPRMPCDTSTVNEKEIPVESHDGQATDEAVLKPRRPIRIAWKLDVVLSSKCERTLLRNWRTGLCVPPGS